jgi:hypothetical protein
MLLAVCINPSGPVMLLYPFKTVSIGALQEYIQEWQSPDFHARNVQPFIWMALLTFGAVGASRRRISMTDFLLFSVFFYMGLLAGRNLALFSLAAALPLARHASTVLESWGRFANQTPVAASWRSRRQDAVQPSISPRMAQLLNLIILIVLALAALLKALTVFPASINETAFEEMLPVEAVETIRDTQPPGRLFNSYNWGGYLLWALPEYPVFVDGRTDLYNDEIISQWLQIMRGEAGWQAALERWDVRLALIEPGMPLARLLDEAGWTLLYQDDQAVVYGR